MKTNAIIRIVIWSLVIFVLAGVLLGGLGFLLAGRNLTVSTSTVESIAPQKVDPPKAESQSTAPTIEDTRELPRTASSRSFAAEDIRRISIEWVSGSITIQPADITEILVSEDGASENAPMEVQIKKGKLSIAFCEERKLFDFRFNTQFSKDLTIQVPQDWYCQELEIDAASATLEVHDLSFREIEIDTASGSCTFVNCSVDSLDIDTASGNVEFSGSLNVLECDAASASFVGVLENVPSRIDMDSASGDLELTLPEDAGFVVDMETMSSDFYSTFETTVRNGCYVHGDGACRIDLNAMSGDVIVRKGSSTAASNASCPIPDHIHSESCYAEGSNCPDPHHEHTDTCRSGKHH